MNKGFKEIIKDALKDPTNNFTKNTLTLEDLNKFLQRVFKTSISRNKTGKWDIVCIDDYFSAQLKSKKLTMVTGLTGFVNCYMECDEVVYNNIKLTPEQITKLINLLKTK